MRGYHRGKAYGLSTKESELRGVPVRQRRRLSRTGCLPFLPTILLGFSASLPLIALPCAPSRKPQLPVNEGIQENSLSLSFPPYTNFMLLPYFALKTNATAVNNKCETTGNCDLMEIKNQLCYTSDNIIDYSPKDTKRAKSVNASLNLGSSASANIGISFETDAGPTIHTTYDSANHAVSWKVSRYWFFGSTFNNQRLSFGTSWASTGRVASINISAYARFLGNKINHIANWDTRNVTYRY